MRRCPRGSRRCKASEQCVENKAARPLNANGTRFRCNRENGVNQRQCADRRCYPSRFFANDAVNLRDSARTISNRLVSRHTLRAMKTALFDPFLPLMIPLSGVVQMAFLKKGDKKIFLIGEIHTTNFCRDRGMTPIAQIIEAYLQQDNGVDFMIEMPNFYVPAVPVAEVRQIANAPVNRFPFLLHQELQVLSLTRIILSDNVVRPTRIHWLEPDFPPVVAPLSTGDRLINAFMEFMHEFQRHYYNANSYVDSAVYKAIRDKITSILRDGNRRFRPKWRDGAVGDTNFEAKSTANKLLFFTACYNTLSSSKFFIKCRLGGPREINLKVYKRAFAEMWDNEADKRINRFYFLIQRFIMDMFTCCRIMKTEDRFFKNIVIYAGDWHVQNYINILTQLDFTRYKLPHEVRFNPECS
jgi:hypothetical protein